MLRRVFPLPIKYICGVIYSVEEVYLQAIRKLSKRLGPLDYESEKINFNYTDYYNEEMGSPLYRRFVAFERLRDPATLLNVKLFTLKIENIFSKDGRRQINIDPGYIDKAKLVLATTKDFYHRIYLGKGIYAEVTLHYQNKDFQDFSTTYPDYRSRLYKDIFIFIRGKYLLQIKDL